MAKNDGGPAFPCGSFEPQPGRVCIMDDDYSYLNSLGDAIELLQSFDRSVSALNARIEELEKENERLRRADCGRNAGAEGRAGLVSDARRAMASDRERDHEAMEMLRNGEVGQVWYGGLRTQHPHGRHVWYAETPHGVQHGADPADAILASREIGTDHMSDDEDGVLLPGYTVAAGTEPDVGKIWEEIRRLQAEQKRDGSDPVDDAFSDLDGPVTIGWLEDGSVAFWLGDPCSTDAIAVGDAYSDALDHFEDAILNLPRADALLQPEPKGGDITPPVEGVGRQGERGIWRVRERFERHLEIAAKAGREPTYAEWQPAPKHLHKEIEQVLSGGQTDD